MNIDQILDQTRKAARCAHCREPFTLDEWENRHDATFDDDEDQRYVHSECCVKCNNLETQRRRRGHAFYPNHSELPKLYATEGTALVDKIIGAHFFVGGCDWWVVEYNPTEFLAWGYACLGDPGSAEWGYVSLAELEAIRVQGAWVVERDLHWQPLNVGNAHLPGRPT